MSEKKIINEGYEVPEMHLASKLENFVTSVSFSHNLLMEIGRVSDLCGFPVFPVLD